ncbi:Pyridoxal phosphate-dependent transferase, major domain protein [Niveomyces insectorum RCEF 264]|uniref:Pyridoxal phosphate-dependent transferase, major domain protein n=1 Tax=Niveomyces insectorum RCEF 264 TaxID=1081102 RepID=A0A162IC41_9HYPO|nr:Pyridoxal phosphate-dependent transferase, major domain protein [Niveomyces insectorum RCEF 264]
MLSSRGAKSAASIDIPWRFAPGGNNPYDAVSNPTGVISFATAENNLMHEELHHFVQKNVSIPQSAYAYRYSTMGGTRFPAALAAHINTFFRPAAPVRAQDVITASGLTAIHELLGYSLADPGEGILVSRPIYGRFELDFGNTSALRMVYADMDGVVDPLSAAAVPKYAAALQTAQQHGIRVRALLIVNPNNPLGRTYTPDALRALMAFCEANSLHLVSDEVYALTAEEGTFTSVLSLDCAGLVDENRVHVLYGMSKDFAAAGLRLGSLVTRNTSLRKAVACNMRFHNPSGPSIAIGTAILNDTAFVASFMALSRARLHDSRAFTMRVLDEAGVRYQKANAGFFLFIDLSPWLEGPATDGHDREYSLAQKLLDAGVGLHPCEEHADTEGQFRLVFSQEREILTEGLKR